MKELQGIGKNTNNISRADKVFLYPELNELLAKYDSVKTYTFFIYALEILPTGNIKIPPSS